MDCEVAAEEAKDGPQVSTCHVCRKKFKDPEKLSLHMGFHSLFGSFKKAAPVADSSVPEKAEEGEILLFCLWVPNIYNWFF